MKELGVAFFEEPNSDEPQWVWDKPYQVGSGKPRQAIARCTITKRWPHRNRYGLTGATMGRFVCELTNGEPAFASARVNEPGAIWLFQYSGGGDS